MTFTKPTITEISGGRMFTNQTLVIFEENEDYFGNILELAEHLGWEDTHGDATTYWEPENADDCEDNAIFYLNSLGVWIFVKNEDGNLEQRV